MSIKERMKLTRKIQELMQYDYEKYCHYGFSAFDESTWMTIIDIIERTEDIDLMEQKIYLIEDNDKKFHNKIHNQMEELRNNTWKQVHKLVKKYRKENKDDTTQ